MICNRLCFNCIIKMIYIVIWELVSLMVDAFFNVVHASPNCVLGHGIYRLTQPIITALCCTDPLHTSRQGSPSTQGSATSQYLRTPSSPLCGLASYLSFLGLSRPT